MHNIVPEGVDALFSFQPPHVDLPVEHERHLDCSDLPAETLPVHLQPPHHSAGGPLEKYEGDSMKEHEAAECNRDAERACRVPGDRLRPSLENVGKPIRRKFNFRTRIPNRGSVQTPTGKQNQGPGSSSYPRTHLFRRQKHLLSLSIQFQRLLISKTATLVSHDD